MATAPVVVSTDLRAGSVIAGRYRVISTIGRGGMGIVLLAEHIAIGRKVAVKVLSRAWVLHDEARRRFIAEARMTDRVDHPGIVSVIDAGDLSDGRPFLAMEYLDGLSLLAAVRARGPFAPDRALAIARDVADALVAAHAVGIVHRDLKSDNVMLVTGSAGEQVKVLDFGVAAALRTDPAARMTTPGLVLGTPAYMPPEQGLGFPATPSFDVYALGAVMFEMLCGTTPFEGDDPLKVIGAKATTPAPSIATKRAGLPRPLVELVDACLASSPTSRPADMVEVRTRLDAMLRSRAATRRTGRHVQRQRIAAAATVVAALSWAAVTIAGATPTPLPTLVGVSGIGRDDSIFIVPYERTAIANGAPTAASDPPPVPRKPRARPVSPAPSRLDTLDCERMRTRALEAREAHDWTGVLRNVTDSSCWGPLLERRRLHVKAALELGRFAECIELGDGSRDSFVRKSVDLCRRRLDRG